ncbi:MAG: hypothetical protein KDG50_05785 [Chromatiales bacterium]|nr:hypothetical protein [Chromatiales bacterium]
MTVLQIRRMMTCQLHDLERQQSAGFAHYPRAYGPDLMVFHGPDGAVKRSRLSVSALHGFRSRGGAIQDILREIGGTVCVAFDRWIVLEC